MNATAIIDKAGRIVRPKALREKLRLTAGDHLEMEGDEDRIVLRPARGGPQIRKKRGIWVYRSDEPLSAATVRETLEQVRRERDERNLGKLR